MGGLILGQMHQASRAVQLRCNRTPPLAEIAVTKAVCAKSTNASRRSPPIRRISSSEPTRAAASPPRHRDPAPPCDHVRRCWPHAPPAKPQSRRRTAGASRQSWPGWPPQSAWSEDQTASHAAPPAAPERAPASGAYPTVVGGAERVVIGHIAVNPAQTNGPFIGAAVFTNFHRALRRLLRDGGKRHAKQGNANNRTQ